jgi:hypothetical protein
MAEMIIIEANKKANEYHAVNSYVTEFTDAKPRQWKRATCKWTAYCDVLLGTRLRKARKLGSWEAHGLGRRLGRRG